MRRALVIAAAIGLIAPSQALAHAFLVRSDPAAQSTVKSAPTRVLLVFDEEVSPSHIDVTSTGGRSVLGGKAHVVKGARNEILVPLRAGLPKGGYVVRWSEVDADDGHLISGTFGFGVGEPAPAVKASSGSSFSFGETAARWLMLLGLLVAAGLVVFRRFVLRGAGARRLELVAAAAAGVAALGAGLLLARQPTPLTTRFDRTTLVGGAVALAASLLGFASFRVAEVLMLALLVLPALDGHAIAPGVSHLLSIPSDVVHVAAASVWIGGVLALAGLVAPEQRRAAVHRFAPLALAAVAALALTGVLRALSELRSVSQLWSTSYGQTMLVKTALFLALLVIAGLARGRPHRRSLVLEAALLFSLVVAVAVLVGLRPGRDVPTATAAQPAAFVTAAEVGAYAVGVSLVPGEGDVEATATVLAIGGPARGVDVAFRTAAGRVAASACGAGCFRASLPVAKPSDLSVSVGHVEAKLVVPQLWPPPSGGAILAKANGVFRALRTLTVVSRLSSTPASATTTVYRMEAPNRLSGVERGTGAGAIIIGGKRWDRDSATAPWVPSPAFAIHQPSLPWPSAVRDVHVAGRSVVGGKPVWILSFLDPATPSWFRIAVDAQSGRTMSMDMVATAHFMHEDYSRFDEPTPVRPPKRR